MAKRSRAAFSNEVQVFFQLKQPALDYLLVDVGNLIRKKAKPLPLFFIFLRALSTNAFSFMYKVNLRRLSSPGLSNLICGWPLESASQRVVSSSKQA